MACFAINAANIHWTIEILKLETKLSKRKSFLNNCGHDREYQLSKWKRLFRKPEIPEKRKIQIYRCLTEKAKKRL